jgi:pimeloyl-ACP methyl ester carboxylesterase
MSISAQLGEEREATLPEGPIRYRERGTGEPVLFVHGAFVNGDLWRKVVPPMSERHRCITPDWPLGSHQAPMEPDADLTPRGVARIIDAFIRELHLEGVTLVGNDTGGALSQIVAAYDPDRLARLVLTDCDAFDNLPPRGAKLMARALGTVPGAVTLAGLMAWPTGVKRLMMRVVVRTMPPKEILESYVPRKRPSAGVRRDIAKLCRGLDARHTLEAAERLRGFDKPALLAWSPEDRFFPYAHARRLAALLPQARLEPISESRTFVPEDQPERLADAIEDFVRATSAAREAPVR